MELHEVDNVHAQPAAALLDDAEDPVAAVVFDDLGAGFAASPVEVTLLGGPETQPRYLQSGRAESSLLRCWSEVILKR